MATANEVLAIARGEVGYYAPDDPEAGSKYGRWMADLTGESWLRGSSTSVWWCCMFVSWCLAQAGQGCTGFPSYNTDVVLGKGPQLVYREDARPGDIIIWDWDGNGATDHIGFVMEHETGGFGTLKTVEGNYRNSVAVVDRSDVWGLVAAVIRPPYDAEGGAEPEPAPVPMVSDEDYLDEVARMVINGAFGNGSARIDAIYTWVQARVNELCSGGIEGSDGSARDRMSLAVIQGDYGNGDERRYNIYAAVQQRVNELLS